VLFFSCLGSLGPDPGNVASCPGLSNKDMIPLGKDFGLAPGRHRFFHAKRAWTFVHSMNILRGVRGGRAHCALLQSFQTSGC
jgi:hypothetical protein